ncbi:hypothetical protein NGB36_28675 [Streptomyces sp. RB6PN25]|uniref:Uncharacterized protein n=1 Tax=Streptomyces humicola TaxID=2953240 RepID=A0ABT1Q3I2_9ACTN|nr:hypothetical protein [Streptomyces humicola]
MITSLAEGDGEIREPVSYESSRRRWDVLHRIEPFTTRLCDAGFDVAGFSRRSAHREWLHIRVCWR